MSGAENRPVVLLTDFGCQDIFAGVLKGVIASISPGSKVIDLSHGVKPQDILHGSFLLTVSFSYFPRKSVFCVVVDPTVGSDRKCICIETCDYYFVGPDNGILWQAAQKNKIKQIIDLTNSAYFLESISSTFQGRDVFAPVAAHISKGLNDMSCLGTPLETCIELCQPEIKFKDNWLELTIIHIDGFGNISLNITGKHLRQVIQERQCYLKINDITIKKIYTNYSQANKGELFLIESSSSFMEISCKNLNAARILNAKCGDKAVLNTL